MVQFMYHVKPLLNLNSVFSQFYFYFIIKSSLFSNSLKKHKNDKIGIASLYTLVILYVTNFLILYCMTRNTL
jgi:hypothetical protein